MERVGGKFIRVSTASGGDKIPEGEFCYDKRAIQEIKVNDVSYYLGGALDSTGTPILLWGYRAIGMQTQSGSSRSSDEHRALVPIRNGNSLFATALFQWQKCSESLEKRISELENSHIKDKKSNASAMQIIKHGDIEEPELIIEKYINVSSLLSTTIFNKS